MSDDRAAGVLGSLREGWHGLAGGDARSCPGCPVCAITEQAGRLDPAATEHLQAAAGHLAAAGRELLAVLGGRAPARPVPGTEPPDPAGDPAGDPAAGATDRPADPDDAPGPAWTTITVTGPETHEEHP